jgi:hypothetical protein
VHCNAVDRFTYFAQEGEDDRREGSVWHLLTAKDLGCGMRSRGDVKGREWGLDENSDS